MHPDVLACLRCPVCRGPFTATGAALRCASGHAFDVARHGYVSFLTGRGTRLLGDDAQMVAARARFLAAGHFAPLADAVAEHAASRGPGAVEPGATGERGAAGEAGRGAPRLVLEVGAGTAYYLARAVSAAPGSVGLAVDLSRHAARHAARVHGRVGAVVADARGALPLADACAGLVLDVFAPRNVPEIRRVLREDGAVLVVTPAPEHLAELRRPLGLLDLDPEKERRLAAAFEPSFERASSTALAWTMRLPRADVHAVATMGPSARHLDAAELTSRVNALPEQLAVTAAVRISLWRPRRVAPATAPDVTSPGSPSPTDRCA